ncbi:MAG: reverse transcriptase domain-containing protein [Bacteroidales bacterium]
MWQKESYKGLPKCQQFSASSYGFRPGVSAQDAVLKSVETMNQGKDWIVDIDLERFFDTVHHDRLMNLIARTVKDGDVISLIRKYLVSGVMIGATYEDTHVGTPQGGNISPLLSNIMLNELDKELEERGLHFVRYADDCIIFTGSKKSAERVMKSVTRFIEERLGLKVNATKSKIGRPKDIKYLGYGFYKDKEGGYHLVPHKQSVQKFVRRLKRLTKRNWSVSLTYRLKKLKEVIVGWVNYFKLGRMKTVLRTIDQKLRSRIRVIIWKQWKVSKRQIDALVRLGIDEESAKAMTSERSYRKGWGKGESIKELIRCSGTQFDPEIVDVFVNQVLPYDSIFEVDRAGTDSCLTI